MNRHTGYPQYFHGASTLYYYRSSEYAEALNEAMNYQIPALFWAYLLRVACYGQLNKLKEARVECQQLLRLKPDFPVKAHFLISRYDKEEELIKHVIKGLVKGGLTIHS